MNLAGALGGRGQEDSGRRRHPQRHRMMLSDVITVEPCRIVFTQQFQPTLVEAVEAVAAALDMVKNPEFDFAHRLRPECGKQASGKPLARSCLSLSLLRERASGAALAPASQEPSRAGEGSSALPVKCPRTPISSSRRRR